jgi:hypothetical protein
MKRRDDPGRYKVRKIKLVSIGLIIALFLIALLAVLEQGPPNTYLYIGASPLNTGRLGTSDLFLYTKTLYPRTQLVLDWSRVFVDRCSNIVIVIISPETPYTDNDLSNIEKVLRKCSTKNFLIADESTISNAVLTRIGSDLRITGEILVETVDQYTNTSLLNNSSIRPILITRDTQNRVYFVYPTIDALYPIAKFDLGNRSVELRLDIASRVIILKSSNLGRSEVIGYVNEVFIANKTDLGENKYIASTSSSEMNGHYIAYIATLYTQTITQPGSSVATPILMISRDNILISQSNVSIAIYEDLGNSKVILFSDGSIFLNQVLRSNYNSSVLEIYRYALNKLCGSSIDCIVLFDASKYNTIDPYNAIKQPSSLRLIPMDQIIAFFLAKILHPTTWLPLVVSWFNELVIDLLRLSFMRPLIIILLSLLFSLIWLRRETAYRDYVMEEVSYRDILHFEELINQIRKGRYILHKKDFINLYEYINETLQSYLGADLRSNDLPRILSVYGVSREFSEKYQRFMNKYYERALGKKLIHKLTPVLWSRVVRKGAEWTLKILRELEKNLRRDLV